MNAVVEEYNAGRRIVVDLAWVTEEYAEEVCRGINSYLELVESLEYEVEHDAGDTEEAD